MKKSFVSINIVNWNGGTDIIRCLESVYAQSYKSIKEVVVVDNGSTDNSLADIGAKFPRVTILRNDFNMGFCKAHNQAFRVTTGELVLLLNFDILLEKDFLEHMVVAMATDDRIGMVSGKLYRSVGGMKTKMLDSTGIVMEQYFSAPRGEGEEDVGQYDAADQRVVFGPCGAAPLYRRAMLEDIKCSGEYFDEDFVNYAEDVDLAWRAQLKGWQAIYEPLAIAFHERGVSRKANLGEQYNYFFRGFRNRYLAMYKNITAEEWKKAHLKILFRELLFLLAPHKGMNTIAVRWGALREAMQIKPLFASKRKLVQSQVTVSSGQMAHFFEYGKYSFFCLLWDHIKDVACTFLSKFETGRALMRRYRVSKRKRSVL